MVKTTLLEVGFLIIPPNNWLKLLQIQRKGLIVFTFFWVQITTFEEYFKIFTA
jgi:hypothetical protein